MNNLYNQKVINANNVFDDTFLDVKTLYVYSFNMLPSIRFIKPVDGEKAFYAIREKFAENIKDIHQRKWYRKSKKAFEFDKTIVIMTNNCVIEFDTEYCEILHDNLQPEVISTIVDAVLQFKEKQRRLPLEINLIVQNRRSLALKSIEIKRTTLDLDLFYEDNFKETHETIRRRLRKNNDKGVVLLHGLPGTGKTTYLRYLIGKIRKRVLFLSPAVAGDLLNPEFVELLIDNPNSVLIIEDAENIIMDRRHSKGSSVSTLLNISDGLLADFLNVQLICTFNNSLTMVDSALLRKGRMIAKHEFGKLNIEKSQRLSKHFGFETVIREPMTIAEIANQHEKQFDRKKIELIGFRRQGSLMN